MSSLLLKPDSTMLNSLKIIIFFFHKKCIRFYNANLIISSLKSRQLYTKVTQLEVAEVVRSRLGEIFQGSGKMTELARMHESGHRTDGAAQMRYFNDKSLLDDVVIRACSDLINLYTH